MILLKIFNFFLILVLIILSFKLLKVEPFEVDISRLTFPSDGDITYTKLNNPNKDIYYNELLNKLDFNEDNNIMNSLEENIQNMKIAKPNNHDGYYLMNEQFSDLRFKFIYSQDDNTKVNLIYGNSYISYDITDGFKYNPIVSQLPITFNALEKCLFKLEAVNSTDVIKSYTLSPYNDNELFINIKFINDEYNLILLKSVSETSKFYFIEQEP